MNWQKFVLAHEIKTAREKDIQHHALARLVEHIPEADLEHLITCIKKRKEVIEGREVEELGVKVAAIVEEVFSGKPI